MENLLCLIMLGGEAPGPLAAQALLALLKERPYVVAADSGAEHLLRLGLTPQLVAGDGDSLAPQAREACREAGAKFLTWPREKDFTDGEAALAAALEAGYRRVAIFGAFGGRTDHLLGNLLLPLAYRNHWESCVFYGEGFTVRYCFGDHTLNGRPGDTVSLVGLSAQVKGITLQGFRYPLLAYDTELGSSRCLSNELMASQGRVSFESGVMLVIHYAGQAL